jgi:hypothetical protein
VTKTKNDGKAFEKFVTGLTKQLLRSEGITVRVKHNASLVGRSGLSHQVDVYWEVRIAGILHRVVIECRDWASRLSMDHVQQLQGKLVDLPGCRGVLVSQEGFQSGAVELARQYDIVPQIMRVPRDEDYSGFLRSVLFRHCIKTRAIKEIRFVHPPEWVDAQSAEIRDRIRLGVGSGDPYQTLIRDNDSGNVTTLAELVDHLPETDGPASYRVHWSDADLIVPSQLSLKISDVVIIHETQSFEFDSLIEQERDVGYIGHVLEGRRQFVRPDGFVYGDSPSRSPHE